MSKPIPFGKYYLLERINVGGMAEVFKAKAFGVEGFERLIAVKRILPNIAEDEEFITMFIDEAKIAGQLQHANIAQIFDLGKVDDAYFIAMEYISGKDLRAIFDHLRKLDLTMPIPQLCYVIMQVCEGLDFAHNKKDTQGRSLNLVHRDVSPQNVLIGFEGEVKLVDFGIAKAAGKASKTQAGILKGKFGYMSPEQVRGLPIDRRSDIFSVGICMYELLTGERLFTGESDFSTLEKVRNVEILPPTSFNKQISPELERIVLKALAKDADDRYQNAIDLHDDLQAYLYSTGELCSRKDLAAWMKRSFATEIEEENAKLEQYAKLSEPTPGPAAGTQDGSQTNAAVDEKLSWDEEEMETQIFDKVPEELEAEELSSADLFIGDQGDTSAGKPTPAMTARGVGMKANLAAMTSERAELGGFDIEEKTVAQAPPDALLADMGAAAAHAAARQVQHSPVSSLVAGLRPPGGLAELRGIPSSNGAALTRLPTGRPDLGSTLPGLGSQATGYRAQPPLPAPSGGAPVANVGASIPSPGLNSRLGAMAYAQNRPGRRIAVYAVGVLAAVLVLWLIISQVNKPGTLLLVFTPPDAKVLVDGTAVEHDGTGTLLLSRKAGPYSLTFESAGYERVVQSVEVESGVKQKIEVVLRPAADTGFQLRSTPSGLPVFLDGKPLTLSGDGTGPPIKTDFKADGVAPGRHVLELRGGADYEDWRYEFVQEPGKILDIHAELKPKAAIPERPGSAPSSASSVEPRPVVSASRPVVALAPRPVESRPAPAPRPVESRPAPAPRPVEPRPASASKPALVDATAETGVCHITIGAKPWAQVSVDGKDTGKITPLVNFEVPCGKRKITFVNSELGIEKTVTVTVKSGEKFKQVFDLVNE